MSGKSTFKYGKYLALGGEIAAAIAVPIIIGYFLDEYFGTSPWLILAGCLVGMVNVFVMIFRLADQLNKE